MGLKYPKNPPGPGSRDGDEVTEAPTKSDRSLLGAERGTDHTRRLETDANRNLYVNVAADGRTESLLYTATLSTIAASTPTAFVAYTPASAVKVYKVLISGAVATDFNLRHNGSSIGKKYTNLEMQVEYDFDQGFELAALDTLDAVVEHCLTGKTKDFDIYVYGE
jgi:hypothetical protein